MTLHLHFHWSIITRQIELHTHSYLATSVTASFFLVFLLSEACTPRNNKISMRFRAIVVIRAVLQTAIRDAECAQPYHMPSQQKCCLSIVRHDSLSHQL